MLFNFYFTVPSFHFDPVNLVSFPLLLLLLDARYHLDFMPLPPSLTPAVPSTELFSFLLNILSILILSIQGFSTQPHVFLTSYIYLSLLLSTRMDLMLLSKAISPLCCTNSCFLS